MCGQVLSDIAQVSDFLQITVHALIAYDRQAEAFFPAYRIFLVFFEDGKNIRVGRNVFVNHACEFMDRGGITIGYDVLIGPKVNLVTINHPLDPARRRATYCAPIVIERGAWLGAAVSVMPGVTIGENAVVAANAVVTKNVPPNAIVGGVPARFIRWIEPGEDPPAAMHAAT